MKEFPKLRPEMFTSYWAPWMLVRRGGQQDGERPGTVLAFCREAFTVDGEIAYKAWLNRQGRWTVTAREVSRQDVVREWRTQPSAAQIAKARKSLAKAINA